MSINHVEHVIIKLHLNSENFNKKETVEAAASMFILLVQEENYVRITAGETFYNINYKHISTLVFTESFQMKSNAFSGFITTVKEEISNTYKAYDLIIKHEHIVACYDKFAAHIELAVIQKDFMLNVAKEARQTASLAKDHANFAEKQAEKARKMSSSMVTNFVSILGIFASIIFTLFGGVSLIGSMVKLLEVNSKLPYLTFIVALLMICLLTLLKMMVNWVNSIGMLKNALDAEKKCDLSDKDIWKQPLKWDFYTQAVCVFIIVALASLAGIYFIKDKPFYISKKETTSELKQVGKAESQPNHTNTEKVGETPQHNSESRQNNQETKVVKTLIVSNNEENIKDKEKDEKKEDE